ncbi:hypothetical protein CCACVL1_12635 [Corchorus capsularis]|uniref:Cystatin domain-containing protein n=1 Tax=Corchorus capsularis TaxID=210143 RepID=A0A1R3IEN1_COCAP|nr:hypothetical protein CCACVL1_12635 [Corchorus capsularis]
MSATSRSHMESEDIMSAVLRSHLKSEDIVRKPPRPISEPPKDIVAKRLIFGPISEPPIVRKPVEPPHKPPFSGRIFEPPKVIVPKNPISGAISGPISEPPIVRSANSTYNECNSTYNECTSGTLFHQCECRVDIGPISEDVVPKHHISEPKPPITPITSDFEPPKDIVPKHPISERDFVSKRFSTVSDPRIEYYDPGKDRENIAFDRIWGTTRPIRKEDFCNMFGLDVLCVIAIDSFNRKHNTKYEFLKIERANKHLIGRGHVFYIIFQARQNATTQNFQTLVYKDFVTKDITLDFCGLNREACK